jgi:hypothetical protein
MRPGHRPVTVEDAVGSSLRNYRLRLRITTGYVMRGVLGPANPWEWATGMTPRWHGERSRAVDARSWANTITLEWTTGSGAGQIN